MPEGLGHAGVLRSGQAVRRALYRPEVLEVETGLQVGLRTEMLDINRNRGRAVGRRSRIWCRRTSR